jgi:hypothetical protein
VIAGEGRLAALTALRCIVDRTTCARGSARGEGAGRRRLGGMGSARGVRGGRWPVVTLMLVVLWA